MKRILFISKYLNRNGTEAFMMNVVRQMQGQDLVFDFLLYSPDQSDYCQEVEQLGGTIWRVPSRRESFFGWYRSLRTFFRQHASQYAAVHFCANSLSGMAPLFFAWRYGVPVRIVHAHNSSARGWHNRLLHLLKRDFTRLITTHHLACSERAARWFFGGHPAQVISNGIDVRAFAFDADVRLSVRQQMGIDDRTFVLGFVGRLVEEKNPRFLLPLFRSLLPGLSCHAQLWIVGDGPLRQELQSEAEVQGVADSVRFLGVRTDVNRLMQAMDCLLMPSLFEGLPYVLIEAQCAGLPCVIAGTITSDICLSSSVRRLPLSDPDLWRLALSQVSTQEADRSQGLGLVSRAGYDVRQSLFQLRQIYES